MCTCNFLACCKGVACIPKILGLREVVLSSAVAFVSRLMEVDNLKTKNKI